MISSNEVFHLPELPKRIVIQGGGYIALEFACIFAGFGSDVTWSIAATTFCAVSMKTFAPMCGPRWKSRALPS